MNLIDNIIRCEIDFARDFSNAVDQPWGVLFHNADIPNSHDSNHACILDPGADLPAVINRLVEFYRGKQITPRVYHLGTDGGDALRSALAAAGFTFRDHSSVFLVRRQKSTIRPSGAVSIRRLTRMTPPLCQMIERSDGIRMRKVVERRLSHSTYQLLVGFVNGEPCSMAALQVVGGLTRVDDVLTDVPHRGKGYNRAVMDHAVRYHADYLGSTTLYLFTDNPTAERIYREAGFVDVGVPLCHWSASLESGAC